MESYYEENKERIKNRMKKYYQKNKEKIKRRIKDRYKEKKEEILEQQKGNYIKNKKVILEKRKRYYIKNKKIIAQKQKIYWKKNFHKWRRYHKEYQKRYSNTYNGKISQLYRTLKYLSRKNKVFFNLNKEELIKIWEKQKCFYCGSKERLEIDHKIPYKKRGDTIFNNLVVCCIYCNNRKHTKTANEFLNMIEEYVK